MTPLWARLSSAWPSRAGSASARAVRCRRRQAHDGHVAPLGNRTDAGHDVRDDLVWVERLERQRCLAGLDHGEVEQLIDELGEVIGLALDLGGEVAHGRVVVDRA